MLYLDKVQKTYKDFTLDCSLEVLDGHITGLIGANGAGKSTTFKAILDLIKLDGGKITIFDKDYRSLTRTDKERLGVVMAEGGFSEYLNVSDLVGIQKCLYKKFSKDELVKKCQQFNIPMNKAIREFSTGMRAKLKLIVALSHEADFLILDEPTSGLDVVAREEILDMLRAYMETPGRSILISSHISSDLEGFCDDIYMLGNGSIVFHDDTDTIMDQYGILKLDEKQYEKINTRYVVYRKKESFGYKCLVSNKQFYADNYRDIVVEKDSIDEIVSMIAHGEKINNN